MFPKMLLFSFILFHANCKKTNSKLTLTENNYRSLHSDDLIFFSPINQRKIIFSGQKYFDYFGLVKYYDCKNVTSGNYLDCDDDGYIEFTFLGSYFSVIIKGKSGNKPTFRVDGKTSSPNRTEPLNDKFNYTFEFNNVDNHTIRITSTDHFYIYNLTLFGYPSGKIDPTESPTPLPPQTPSLSPLPPQTDSPSPSLSPLPPQTDSPSPSSSPLPPQTDSPSPSPSPLPPPSSAPTSEPTSVPTSEPTSVPTSEPTSAPTPEPTSAPTPELITISATEYINEPDPGISTHSEKGLKKSSISIIVGIIAATLIISACSIFAAMCFCNKPLPIVPVGDDENETIQDSDPNAGIDDESESSIDQFNDAMVNPNSHNDMDIPEHQLDPHEDIEP